MVQKIHTSWRISWASRELLRILAVQLGISQRSVFELAIRELAERKSIPIPLEQTLMAEPD